MTLVEFALVLPIFFALVLLLLDLGNAYLQTSQATSAAVDGARVAIVLPSGGSRTFSQAAVSGSPANEAIKKAVRARVVGQVIADSDIVVKCGAPGTTPTASYCASPALDRQRDKVVVSVQWIWKPFTFVGQALPVQSIKGTSTMAIVFIPTGFTGTTTTVPSP